MSWCERNERQVPPFLYLGDPAALADRARMLSLDVPLRESTCLDAAEHFAEALPVLPIQASVPVIAGKPTSLNAPGVTGAIEKGVELVLAGQASGLVTAPIAKSVL